jgi:hypothetical protein
VLIVCVCVCVCFEVESVWFLVVDVGGLEER